MFSEYYYLYIWLLFTLQQKAMNVCLQKVIVHLGYVNLAKADSLD